MPIWPVRKTFSKKMLPIICLVLVLLFSNFAYVNCAGKGFSVKTGSSATANLSTGGDQFGTAITGNIPSITSQPGSVSISVGSYVSFTVSAMGTAPLNYQWRKNGSNIIGATAPNYGINAVSTSHAGQYSVVVTNNYGSVISQPAVLTVNAVTNGSGTIIAPSIVSQPTSRVVNAGSAVNFSVVTSGTPPLAFQWRKNGVNIYGATAEVFNISAASKFDEGSYSVKVTNSAGSVISAAASLVINEVLTQVDCVTASANHQFPIPTHWSNVSGITEGASDSIAYARTTPMNNQIYNNLPGVNSLPEHEKYIGTNYSIYKFSNQDATTWASNLCNSYQMAVEFIKPPKYTLSSTSVEINVRASPRSLRKSIQVLAGFRTTKSMYTVLLPPGWTSQFVGRPYPIIFHGAYDLNENLHKIHGPEMVEAMARMWSEGPGYQAIGVIWNGAGAIASRTMNASALTEFNSIIQTVALQFGGDPFRIVTFGASRSGHTALRVAADPNFANPTYKVRAAYAAVPPGAPGSISKLTSATIPALIFSGASWSIGFNNTTELNWRYPSIGNSLSGLTRNQAHLKILTGYTDPDLYDRTESLASDIVLGYLAGAGTRVVLEINSHDIIVPWVDQFRFAKRLSAKQIPHELRVNYLAGHAQDTAKTVNFLIHVVGLLTSDPESNNFISSGSKNYYRVNKSNMSLEKVSSIDRFTIELPRYVYPRVGGHMIATGLQGTAFKIIGRYGNNILGTSGGTVFESVAYTLGADGTYVHNLANMGVSQYIVDRVLINKTPVVTPDNWVDINMNQISTNWSSGKLVVDVLSDNQNIAGKTDDEIQSQIVNGYLGADYIYAIEANFSGKRYSNGRNVSYGICE